MSILLSISVPPSSSVILDEKGSVVQGDIGPFNELSTLILTCDVLGGESGLTSRAKIEQKKQQITRGRAGNARSD